MKKFFLCLATVAMVLAADRSFATPKSKINQPIGTVLTGTASSTAARFSTMDEVKLNHPKIYRDLSSINKELSELQVFSKADGTFVTCKVDGILNKITYTKKGTRQHTVRYYNEESLTADLRHQVKSTYYDHRIHGITEITIGNKTAYVVNLEGKENWIILKLVAGEMEIVRQFNKA